MHRLLPPLLVISVPLGLALPIVSPAPVPIRLAGTVPLLAGVLLTVRSARTFEQVDTNIKTFDDPDQLVRTGAFAVTRNPMYLGFLLLLIGAAVIVGGVTVWVAPVAFFVAANWWYIPFEERRMSAVFGDAYEAYRREVPRWVGPT